MAGAAFSVFTNRILGKVCINTEPICIGTLPGRQVTYIFAHGISVGSIGWLFATKAVSVEGIENQVGI